MKRGKLDTSVNVESIKTDIYSVLDHVEGALISVTEPPLNRQGARFGGVEQYKQVFVELEDIEDA